MLDSKNLHWVAISIHHVGFFDNRIHFLVAFFVFVRYMICCIFFTPCLSSVRLYKLGCFHLFSILHLVGNFVFPTLVFLVSFLDAPLYKPDANKYQKISGLECVCFLHIIRSVSTLDFFAQAFGFRHFLTNKNAF